MGQSITIQFINPLKSIIMKNTIHKELSYFKLSLLHFLYECHPELAKDNDLINTRGDYAAETYSQAIKNGHNHNEAEELANEVLFKGLHFSRHDTLVNILWNEFVSIVPLEEAQEYAIMLLPECEKIFSKYPLSDGFADTNEFDKLYTELIGVITIWIEEHELQ
jgi:hypothetical protein